MAETVLKAEHISKSFISGNKRFIAVDDVSFNLKQGECLGIVGESGSGKSTIAKMITRLEDVSRGQIFLGDQEITKAKGKALRSIYQDIQMVFQNPAESFDPRHTLGDGIGESLRNMGMNRRETNERVELLLEKCGLDKEFAQRYPHQVSGGQCQRAAIARALAVKPSILICDEATSALDVTVQAQVVKQMMDLRDKMGTAIVIVTHNMGVASKMADYIAVMQNGELKEFGTREQVIYHPENDYTKKLLTVVPKLQGETDGE